MRGTIDEIMAALERAFRGERNLRDEPVFADVRRGTVEVMGGPRKPVVWATAAAEERTRLEVTLEHDPEGAPYLLGFLLVNDRPRAQVTATMLPCGEGRWDANVIRLRFKLMMALMAADGTAAREQRARVAAAERAAAVPAGDADDSRFRAALLGSIRAHLGARS